MIIVLTLIEGKGKAKTLEFDTEKLNVAIGANNNKGGKSRNLVIFETKEEDIKIVLK